MVTTPIRSPSLPSSCTPLQNAVCQEIPVVLIHNSTDGVQVVVSSSIVTNLTVPPADQASEQITTISGEFLPDECGPSHKRCNVVVIPYHAQVFALFPVRKGIVIVEYNRTTLDYVSYCVHRTSEDCTPTTLFFTGPDRGYRLFTACVNLSANNSHLKFLRFSFDGSDITVASFHHQSGTEMIYGPDTLSEFVYVHSQSWCMPSTDNVYVLDEGYVIRFFADETEWDFNVDIVYLGCSSYLSVEYYGGNLLLVHCTNETVLTYDTCRGKVISYYHASQSGLPYPCSNWDTVAVVKGGNLTFNTSATSNITSITLPSGDVENAQCVSGGNSFLFVFTVDRTVYTFSTLDEVLLEVVPRSCNSSMCLEPIVLTTEGGTLVGAYDHESSHFIIVNVTCRTNPVILKLPSFQPNLAAMFLGRRQYPCQCESSPTLPTTTMRQTLPTTVTEQSLPTSEQSTHHEPSSESTPISPDVNPNLQETMQEIIFTTAGTVVCFIGVVVVLVTAAVCIRRFRRIRESRRLLNSLPSSVRQSTELLPPERVESVNHGASNCGQEVDQFYVLPDGNTITPEPVSGNGDCDVAGVNDPPMPPESFHYTSVAEMEPRRCSNTPKTNDFKRKVIEFENVSGRADV